MSQRLTPTLRLLAALLCGAVSPFAFAPYQLSLLLLPALMGLLWLSEGQSPRRSALLGWSYGFGLFAHGIAWVHVSIDNFGGLPLPVSLLLMALLASYLALFPALALGLLGRFWPGDNGRRVLAFSALWLVSEWLRGKLLTGFPWLWLGYSQVDGPLAPLASSLGALGLGWLLALMAGAALMLLRRRWLWLLAPAASLLALTALPALNSTERSGDTLSVALVQGNIPQSLKWQPEQLWPTLLKYQDLSRPHMDADLVVWPEAAVPAPEMMVDDFLNSFDHAAGFRGTHVITGIISADSQTREFFNSLLVLGDDDGPRRHQPDDANRYHKSHLLPIGEFVPLESLLRPLAPLFNLPMSSFSRGERVQPNLKAGDVELAPAICYEIAFPEQLRANITADTDLLLTVSNDAWFGHSTGPLQHMEIARMRAMELGKPLLRVTNNGVTAIVDERGRMQAQLPQFEEGVLAGEVALVQGTTLFHRYGQLSAWLLAALSLAAALIRAPASSSRRSGDHTQDRPAEDRAD
ncbi:apolipoprotein N-acyltransferase [Ferrimonas sediminicola]|uniref:Apolipoprotein N-acyltransferase n=1 Tax=Ferrimonas sediminicola TaxID=2569538 RepID=A0A4U1BHI1_9GAMM|nr:apolipoprotein N-acyltransferase [Ferrimonas sediminicola]TKB49481.1 apolipoprotein N-acyltransferase [Ferrimonas sediminicola]